MIKLNAQNLSQLPKEIMIPAYDRSKVKAGIVHVGIGGFHRAHQAFYTDEVLQNQDINDWGICGVALLDADKKIYKTLTSQNGLYTLVVIQNNGSQSVRVIGSIVEYLFAPKNPDAVIEKMASPDIRIISLTITEGGYNFDAASGEFQFETPAVQWDLKNPQHPKTIFGYLAQALKRRKDRGLQGLTILSCDNIQHNGDITKKMLLAYLSKAEPELIQWIAANVTFPNSMVDRITPVTTADDIENLKEKYNIDDAWPVVCEPFRQWIIEDNFSVGKPGWEGVQFVPDVSPYEKMKIRILNGGHSLTGFLGILFGYTYVHEAIRDKTIQHLLERFISDEVIPILEKVPEIDFDHYKQIIIERFGNPFIKDQLTRIISGSSAKIPKFILPTLSEQLDRNGPIAIQCLLIAMWSFYLENSKMSSMQDDMAEILQQRSKESLSGDPLAFLKLTSVFGNLASSKRFIEIFLPLIAVIRKKGVQAVAAGLLQEPIIK